MNQITQQMLTQKINMILIQTPIGQQILTNTTFTDVHNKINKDILKMYQSRNYQYINVHYGVKSKTIQNVNEKLYKRKKQIIQYKIDLQNKYIMNINRAKNENDLQKIQKQYQNNMKLVQKRQKQFDTSQFIPVIYVQAKKRRPYYGKLFQQFDRRGVAMFKATIGYRSPFSIFDKLQISMQTPPMQTFKKRNYYQFNINWSNPTQYFGGSTLFTGATYGSGPIYKGVDEKKYGIFGGFHIGNTRYELQASNRFPRLHQRIAKYCKSSYHLPSSKVSIKIDKTIKDTLSRGQIMTGQLKQAKLQQTIPFISQSQFIKVQYSQRKFIDIFSISKYFTNQKIKSFIRNSNIETNWTIKALSLTNNKISDLLQNTEIRGFENNRRPGQSKLQLKGSIKLNNYNYPFFGNLGFVPFLFTQAGISVQKNIKQYDILGSAGLGIYYPLGKHVNLQVLYCLFQAQNKKKYNRELVNFQIRIGIFD